ncbi:MAG: aldo/keto reductase [Candidatus Micrarchaeia archaeon]
MDTIPLGKSKEKIPILGIGTWKLGADEDTTITVIKEAISKGLRLVDTAQMYQNEVVIGKAISNTNAFICTKVSPDNFHERSLISSCESSLRKLNAKHIDLYQLHWPNPSIKISETMRAMEKLVDEGKIRYIGVSNFSVSELEEAMGVMKKYEISSNQIEYSVLTREFGDSLESFCKSNKITMIAYSPLATGKLYDEKYKGVFLILSEIGLKYNKTPTQVALNWLLQKGNICAIPKISSIKHLNENIGALNWHLSQKDIQKIDEIGQLKAPLASRLNNVTKRMAPVWSKLMTFNESLRINKKTKKKDQEKPFEET